LWAGSDADHDGSELPPIFTRPEDMSTALLNARRDRSRALNSTLRVVGRGHAVHVPLECPRGPKNADTELPRIGTGGHPSRRSPLINHREAELALFCQNENAVLYRQRDSH
jgi:hypothetical protein